MVVTSLAQLEQLLRAEMTSAMQMASDNIHSDIQKNLASFYSVPPGKRYVRTGNLRNSAERTPVTTAGNICSFEAKLNTTHGYTTGTFSKTEVLNAAENHEAGILGSPGFWRKSEERMQERLDSAIRSHFH